MKLVGLTVARNESWCLRASLLAQLKWLDALIVLIHASSDNTATVAQEMAVEHPGRVTIEHVNDPDWNEATYRARLHELGRMIGGTHFAVLDADEILTINAMHSIRQHAFELSHGEMLKMPWIHCWRSVDQYRCDESSFGRAWVPMLFCDASWLAYRPAEDGYELHRRVPAACATKQYGDRDGGVGVLHLQHVVWERVVAKQLLYQMQEAVRWPGRRSNAEIAAQYAPTTNEHGLELKAMPREWWPVDPEMIDFLSVPWQAQACRKMLGDYGLQKFDGLPVSVV